MRPSMSELIRQKAQAEQDLAAARAAGDEEVFFDNFKRIAILDDQIAFMPHLADRWVEEVIADCHVMDDIRDRLRATLDMMARQRLSALARSDHLAAERAGDAIKALCDRLTSLMH